MEAALQASRSRASRRCLFILQCSHHPFCLSLPRAPSLRSSRVQWRFEQHQAHDFGDARRVSQPHRTQALFALSVSSRGMHCGGHA